MNDIGYISPIEYTPRPPRGPLYRTVALKQPYTLYMNNTGVYMSTEQYVTFIQTHVLTAVTQLFLY